jgi:DNA-binding LacI/PurR family transcriptional regulator
VAQRAGVALATASYALRNSPKISEETRLKVKEAAEFLGYRTNAAVARLMAELRRQGNPSDITTLAWVNCNTTRDAYTKTPWLRKWLTGAQKRADQLGYRLEEFWLNEKVMRPERLRSILIARGIPGVLVAPTRSTGGLLPMDCSPFAVATMAGTFHTPNVHQASADNYANVLTAFESLQHLGYERIGFFTSPLTHEWTNHRQVGAYLEMSWEIPAKHRLPLLLASEESSSSRKMFEKWIRRWKPDALLCSGRLQAEWLLEMGLDAPKDIGIAHLNLGPDVGQWAGIDPQIELIAAAAVDMLVGQIHRREVGAPTVAKEILIKGNWVHGATVRKSARPARQAVAA